MKRVLLAFFAGILLVSCGIQSSPQAEGTVEDHLIAEIVSNPVEMEDQLVRFEGTIGHICRHSGDKMRVVQGDDEAYSILVMLGEFAPSFNPELEGMEVIATGVVKTEVLNMAALNATEEHVHDEDCEHEEEGMAHQEEGMAHEEAGHDCESTQEAIALLKEKGIDPDIRVYVELTAFEMK